ncbi:ubiquitin carboxyl-terminal hydrolase, family 1 [Ostertagia ostertagi]
MSDEGVWTLIESDPGVFTEMLRGFGVEGVQVEELHSLSEEETAAYNPIYGLIFLFKWRPGEEPIGEPVDTNNVFFAQQVITNACATQAIINLLMNVNDPKVKLGPVLEEYRDFAKQIDPASRGLVLSNCEKIRQVHNSFARPTFYELDVNMPPSEDNYHFITFVPVGNKVSSHGSNEDASILNLAIVENKIDEEGHKLDTYRRENARRRHNYLPFIVEILRILAKEGRLVPMVEKAQLNARSRLKRENKQAQQN